MTANQVADFIIDIDDLLQEPLTKKEREATIEGAMRKLIKENMTDWNIYKVYCLWTKQSIGDTGVAKRFTMLYNKVEEDIENYEARGTIGKQGNRVA